MVDWDLNANVSFLVFFKLKGVLLGTSFAEPLEERHGFVVLPARLFGGCLAGLELLVHVALEYDAQGVPRSTRVCTTCKNYVLYE